MVRHEVQFVLRFGVFDEFSQLLERLHAIEEAHGWSKQRCWRASGGRMNEMVIEHDYPDRPARATVQVISQGNRRFRDPGRRGRDLPRHLPKKCARHNFRGNCA